MVLTNYLTVLLNSLFTWFGNDPQCPEGWIHFPGTNLELDCLPKDPKAIRDLLQGTCPEGWIDSSNLNEDIGCLYFPEDSATVWAQAAFICDQLGTGTECAGGEPPGCKAKVQRVEASDLKKAQTLGQLAYFDSVFNSHKSAWWLGLSYVKAVSGFAWFSDPTTKIDEAIFASIFQPDDPTPQPDNSLCVLMSYKDNALKWDDQSCWMNTYEGESVGAICQCVGDYCPKTGVTSSPEPTEPTPNSDCIGEWLYVPKLGCIQLPLAAAGLTQADANTACSGIGGYLVELETEEQIKELAKKEELLESFNHDAQTFWLGMKDERIENYWYNPVAGTVINDSIIPWYDGQPNGKRKENCLVATLSSTEGPGWHDVSCDSKTFLDKEIYPICMESSSSATGSTNPSDATGSTNPSDATGSTNPFPNDCQYLNDQLSTCYQYVTDTTSWTDAQKNCESKGGNLVSSLSAEENEYIGQSVIQFESVWLGAQGSGSGGFTWADKSPWGYTNWRAGEPGTSSTEECVFMSASTWQWSAYDCTYHLGFVCKLTRTR